MERHYAALSFPFRHAHQSVEQEANQANRDDGQAECGKYTRLLYSCHRNPTPGVPVSISQATMTSHAIPRLSR